YAIAGSPTSGSSRFAIPRCLAAGPTTNYGTLDAAAGSRRSTSNASFSPPRAQSQEHRQVIGVDQQRAVAPELLERRSAPLGTAGAVAQVGAFVSEEVDDV